MNFNIGLILIIFNLSLVATQKYDPVWPYPQKIEMQNEHLMINSTEFEIKSNSNCDLIAKAIKRYQSRLFIQDCSQLNPSLKGKSFFTHAPKSQNLTLSRGILKSVEISFDGKCERWLQMDMVEGYQLIVLENGTSQIIGSSVWGAIRGLETFSQLLAHTGPNEFQINLVSIEDYPRFSHRGLLIDSSRHFLPLHSIQQTLDAMEMNKMNVLHWHLVDDQSFPFESETFPELSKKGAYGPTHVYSLKDVDSVLEYARLRGIRVVAEFDTPGHTASWGKGRPGLLAECFNEDGTPSGTYGPIDPTTNATYDFLTSLLTEVSQRFPDQYLHLGGDEVRHTIKCWETNPRTKQFMLDNGMGNDTKMLEAYYIDKLVDIVKGLNKSFILWQESFDNPNSQSLSHDAVIHNWLPWGPNGIPNTVWYASNATWGDYLANITAKGFKVLLSSPWYIDVIQFGQEWIGFYQIEPYNFTGTDEQKKLVIGGEACLWGEFVDGANLVSRTWPRASAIAERLWSSASLTSAVEARTRFQEMHCRMQRQGLRPGPIDGPSFCACDYAL